MLTVSKLKMNKNESCQQQAFILKNDAYSDKKWDIIACLVPKCRTEKAV